MDFSAFIIARTAQQLPSYSQDTRGLDEKSSTVKCGEADTSVELLSYTAPSIQLKHFRIDSEHFSLPQSDLKKITVELAEGADAGRLKEIVNSITKSYFDQGYVLSGLPFCLLESLPSGATVQPIETSLENIKFTTLNSTTGKSLPLLEDYLEKRIRQNISTPLNWNTLSDNLALLRNDPLIKSESLRADLFKGNDEYPELISETAELKVFYEPTPSFYTRFSADNHLSNNIGSIRTSSSIGFRNLIGIGDNLGFSYSRSTTGGIHSYDISYQRILNPLNGTLQLRVAPNHYRITESSFKNLGIRGTSTLYEVNLRQPVIRSLRKELALSLGFSAQTGQSFFNQSLPLISTDTKTLKFGQDYRTQNASGSWQLASQFNLGFQTAQSKSSFSWQGQIERLQKLSDRHSLTAQLSLQLTPQNLSTSQEFFLGGAQSLRGYRPNALSGDNGLRFALENRIALARDSKRQDTLIAVPFLDLGYTWNSPSKETSSSKFLAATGLGLIWQPSRNIGFRLDYGIPLSQGKINSISLRDPSLYFSVNYRP
jgi:hemolysin activation/secretion protein